MASDGKQFDSSRQRNQPFKFHLGSRQVIKGWELGVPKLSLGEKAKLIIPYKLGYGEKGYSPNIPPKADLIFGAARF